MAAACAGGHSVINGFRVRNDTWIRTKQALGPLSRHLFGCNETVNLEVVQVAGDIATVVRSVGCGQSAVFQRALRHSLFGGATDKNTEWKVMDGPRRLNQ